MVPGLGWDNFLTIFEAQNHQRTNFSPCSTRGSENHFFTIFWVFLKILSVEPLALITLATRGGTLRASRRTTRSAGLPKCQPSSWLV